MTDIRVPNHASQDWVETIERDRGYSALEMHAFGALLDRMPSYAFFRALLRHLQPGETALEAGCGYALSSFALSKRGVNVTAIDISTKLIADLRRIQGAMERSSMQHLLLLAWDIFHLPEMGATFDVVFSDGTYEHFLIGEDRQLFLKNVRSVLKEQGKFVVAVPNLLNPLFRSVVDRRMPTMHVFTVQHLSAELERGGFTVVETGYSFVNPGFAQWVKSSWMITVVRLANAVFCFLPRRLQKIFAAHLYCVGVRQ